MYKIVSFRYESVIQKNFARLRRAKFVLPPPPNHKSVPTALSSAKLNNFDELDITPTVCFAEHQNFYKELHTL